MRFQPIALAALAAVVACNGDVTAPWPRTETFDWSGTVGPGGHVEIKGITGTITAMPTAGSDVVVHATKHGIRQDPSTVRIDVVPHAAGVTICAVYPDVPGQPPNECQPGLDGSMSVRDNDVAVDFEVRVPAGVDFIGRNITGTITASGIAGDALASTITGDVILAAEIAEATVVTGSIMATVTRADWGRDLAFTTVTGNVTVRVPAATNANAVLNTVTGSLASDFPLSHPSPHQWTGPIGTGGPMLLLATVTGDVRLWRGP